MKFKPNTRLYLNLINKCNVSCDFCCMSSNPSKTTYLSFDRYKEIIDNTDGRFELQLEGGEPLLSFDFYLFMEYAKSTNRCTKIIISTNGFLLKNHLQRLTDFAYFSKIPILIKRSINHFLYEIDNKIFKTSRDLYLATEFIDGVDIRFNVRLRIGDDWLVDLLKEHKIYDISDVYELQNYGRLNDDRYKKPFIVQNIDNWFIYAADGKCFNQNLIERSEYEKTLN